jgi:uncharacterized protein YdeI (YjbR/CyaY-like superfamily)
VPHSSRGPGHRPLKAEITGSNPVCGTKFRHFDRIATSARLEEWQCHLPPPLRAASESSIRRVRTIPVPDTEIVSDSEATAAEGRMAADRTVEQFASQGEFRSWLAANHATSEGIWLKIAKKGVAVPTVTYDEALEIALIFGWIDGQKRALDATFWLQGFTRRGPRSVWSKRNREKAQALIDAGLMEPSGLDAVERARSDDRWANAYDGQREAREPSDLMAALAAKPAAFEFYKTLDRANRYAILYRIQNAKHPETRAARIAKFTAMLDRGDKIHP